MNNIIEIKNMYKSYMLGKEKLNILEDINLNIKKSDFLSIMGPSGCGKSTLLYLIGGLDNVTNGTILVNGKDFSSMKEKQKSIMRRKEIGFVFQFYNLVPNLNVEDNILLPLMLDGKKPKNYEKKLKELLEIMRLSTRRNHTPKELSGGQQQRTAIARALIFEPEIILADEPIGNLDSKSGREIMDLFKTINKDLGKTIVQVTHSEEAAMYGTKTIHLKDGVLN